MARPKEFDVDRVIDLAIDFFARHGYYGPSVDELASYVGIGRGSLYATFGSKRELFLAALQRAYDRQLAASIALLAAHPYTAEGIREGICSWVSDVASDAVPQNTMITRAQLEVAPHDPQARQISADFVRAMTSAMCERVAAGQQNGALSRRFPPDVLANVLSSTYSGVWLQYAIYHDMKIVEDVAQAIGWLFVPEDGEAGTARRG
jgi:TetR/AcrR family transcriptional regulator, transcriptional repressor for nem operon